MRSDLMALDDGKLAQLANRGLVKRARKMLAANTDFQLQSDPDGTLLVGLEDARCKLPLGIPLGECDCSCSARGVCRHLVFAVIAYQQSRGPDEKAPEGVWDPGIIDDQELERRLGTRTLSTARRLAARGVQVEVHSGPPPTALLPICTVSFLVPGSLAHAVCDCATQGPCEHLALAVWAFRQGRAGRVELGASEERRESLEEIHRLLIELLTEGVPSSRGDLPSRLLKAARRLARENMVWMSDLLEEVAVSVDRYRGRAAGYDQMRTAGLLLEWFARERASRGSGELSPAQVLGLGVAPETELEHTRLTSLGVRLGSADETVFSEVFLADPDTSTVLVLQKSWPHTTSRERRNIIRGVKLADLAAGQLVTGSAKRRANRSLVLGRSRVGQSAVFAQTGEWEKLFKSPLLVSDFRRLSQSLVDSAPWVLRARVRAERVRVLQVGAIRDVVYLAGSQQLRALVFDKRGGVVTLKFEHTTAAPGALAALHEQLVESPKFVSGEVRLEREGVVLEPLAVVGRSGVVVPALAQEKPWELEGCSEASPRDPIEAVLVQSVEHLCELSHRGLRWSNASNILEPHLIELRELGFAALSNAFERLLARQKVYASTGKGFEEACEAWATAGLRVGLTREAWLRDGEVQTSG